MSAEHIKPQQDACGSGEQACSGYRPGAVQMRGLMSALHEGWTLACCLAPMQNQRVCQRACQASTQRVALYQRQCSKLVLVVTSLP